MIVSHTRKFIFIKTRKVSGTSMEISLSRACGGEDIITPISYEDELVRLDLGGCLPQNYGDTGEQRWRDLIHARKSSAPWFKPKGRCYNHMPATEVRQLLGPETWGSYFKFTMERHPYEKVISSVYYHARRKAKWDMEQELERVLEKGQYANYPLYCEDGRPLVDFVVNFEGLDADLATLGERLDFDVAGHYPQTKHGYRSDRRPARELLSDAAKERIYHHCRLEFELFGFER
jgi:hypothetical protein